MRASDVLQAAEGPAGPEEAGPQEAGSQEPLSQEPLSQKVDSGKPAPGDPTGAQEIVVGSVRIEVADACARAPRPRPAEGDATDGRGLALVDGLADRWGWEPSGAGKRIWCELDRGPTAPARPPVARHPGGRRRTSPLGAAADHGMPDVPAGTPGSGGSPSVIVRSS